ncbi:MAG: acyl-CoA ligase (AMP-forming), exosortase A system-associated [Psychrobium sp.]
MPFLLHELLFQQALKTPDAKALGCKQDWRSYQQLSDICQQLCRSFQAVNVKYADRIAIYLPKSIEAVVSCLAASANGSIFVPINPAVKSTQVAHILANCEAKVLITNHARLSQIDENQLKTVEHIVLIDETNLTFDDISLWHWDSFLAAGDNAPSRTSALVQTDIAAILYTSGSTGNPKGVVLSHQNLVVGAQSVSDYLPCKSTDIMLGALPLSFDYGFSQITIAFITGASCYLVDYVFPHELFKVIEQQAITTMALVPPLWIALANEPWPEQATKNIRYFCNTGGSMPTSTLSQLRDYMPQAEPFLMYGLTEAFRSCYLPPSEIDNRPTSFGRAIPNANILVINEHGEECAPHEHGELVHCGPLVSQGYWNDAAKTNQRFKPSPTRKSEVKTPELAVWSGDIVTRDEQGYLYFVGRRDDMIKTSGYRVSPQEIEDIIYQLPTIKEAVVTGVPHPVLGQALIAVVIPHGDSTSCHDIMRNCRALLPNFMLPVQIFIVDSLQRNSNGKFDRIYWQSHYQHLFANGLNK